MTDYVVSSGFILEVASNGTVSNTTVSSGGTLELLSGAKTSGTLTFNPGATTKMIASPVWPDLGSDTDETYHVHGYDLEQKVAAGVEAQFEFTANRAGDFEVESHTTNKVYVVLHVS